MDVLGLIVAAIVCGLLLLVTSALYAQHRHNIEAGLIVWDDDVMDWVAAPCTE